MEGNISLADAFKQYFDIRLATTQELKEQGYSIRYRVYCDEFQYEPKENFPNDLEFDEFDAHSLHCLITHKSTKMPAGCVRLVPTIEEGLLPFEKYCAESIDKSFVKGLNLKRGEVCEISRLAVDGAFRRRVGDARTRFGEIDAIDCSHRERRSFSLISVVAFLAATALTDLADRRSVFAMMEPFLPRMLKKSGINFERAGEDIDYHGLRAPYFIRTEEAIRSMHPDLKEIYSYIYGQIKGQFMREISTAK